MEKSEIERNLANEKKLIYSDMWSSEFKKKIAYISMHTLLSLAPFKSFNQVDIAPHGEHFVGQSQACLCGWAAAQSSSL